MAPDIQESCSFQSFSTGRIFSFLKFRVAGSRWCCGFVFLAVPPSTNHHKVRSITTSRLQVTAKHLRWTFRITKNATTTIVWLNPMPRFELRRDKVRNKTTISIGDAFEKWRQPRRIWGLMLKMVIFCVLNVFAVSVTCEAVSGLWSFQAQNQGAMIIK